MQMYKLGGRHNCLTRGGVLLCCDSDTQLCTQQVSARVASQLEEVDPCWQSPHFRCTPHILLIPVMPSPLLSGASDPPPPNVQVRVAGCHFQL